tara:strand:- start:588 stop:761 length:174 start_codon:yes stop_codon:yes gene_type:complete
MKPNEEIICEICEGTGKEKIEFPVPASFCNPYGYIDSELIECESCEGTGYNEKEEED